MATKEKNREECLLLELEDLRRRLAEAEETLRAMRTGEVDAPVVSGPGGIAMLAEEKLSRAVLEQAEQPIIVCDEHGRIVRASRNTRLLCGKDPVQLSFDAALPLRLQSDGEKEAIPPFQIAQVLQGKVFHEAEASYLRRDGQVLSLLLNARPLLGVDNEVLGAVVALTDITARRQADRERQEMLEELQQANVALQSQAEELQIQTEEMHSQAQELHCGIEDLAALTEKLETQGKFLEAVLEQMPGGVLIAAAPSGKLILGNRQVEEIWRHPCLAAADNRECCRFQGFHADGRPYQPEEWPLARSINHGEVVSDQEIFLIRGDGSPGVISVSSAPIRNREGCIVAGVATSFDITARKLAEEALRDSEERYRLLVESSPEAIAVHTDGRFVFLNPAGAKLFGAQRAQELIGKSVIDFVHPDFRKIGEQRLIQVPKQGKPSAFRELQILRLDRQAAKVETRAQRINYQGMPSVQVLIRDITERTRAEAALRESEARFRTIFEGAPIGIVLADVSGRLLAVNSALENMLGYRAEELTHRSFEEITHPEDLGKNLALFKEMLAGKRSHYFLEKRYLHKDGHVVWANLAVSLGGGADGSPQFCIGMVEDIAARKAAEAALERAREELEKRVKERTAALESAYDQLLREVAERRQAEKFSHDLFLSPLIGFYLAQERKFRLVNPGFAHITGFSREELKGRDCLDLVHPEDRGHVRENAVQMLKGAGSPSYEYRTVTKSGEVRWIMETVASSQYRGKRATLGHFMDITARRQAEEALKESEQRLRFLTSQLLTAQERERKRISKDLHDDLGQSLMVLKMQVRGVERQLASNLPGALEECAQTLKYIDEIIENVRRLSRDLSPALLEDLGLSLALRRLFDEFVRYHGVSISLNMDDLTGVYLHEEEIIIYRIFQELLTNIAKHAGATEVAVAVKKKRQAVSFQVADNGQGFDWQRLQARDAAERGLGLAAMDERVRMLGGELAISSRPGKGTRIVFTIPLKQRQAGI
jgi:PAS domain S-box-containing protein